MDGASQCGWCGYDLSGLTGNRCPECGKQITDLGSREAAASLIDNAIAGRVTLADVKELWPDQTADHAVLGACDELWRDLAAMHGLLLTDDAPRVESTRAYLGRWALLLRSGCGLPPGVRVARRRRRSLTWVVVLLPVAAATAGTVAVVVGVPVVGALLLIALIVMMLGVRRSIMDSHALRNVNKPPLLRADVYPFRSRAELDAARRIVEGAV